MNRRIPNGTYEWWERTATQLMGSLLLDFVLHKVLIVKKITKFKEIL